MRDERRARIDQHLVARTNAAALTFESSDVDVCAGARQGFNVRVVPRHDELAARLLPGLITWADPA